MKEMESYTTLKLKNQLLIGTLTEKQKENSRGYSLGRVLRDLLTRIATLQGPMVRKTKTDKEAENMLIECFEGVYSELRDLFEKQKEKE